MGGKLAVATGLLAGAVVGGALVAGFVLTAPAPVAPVLATPSPSVAASPSAAPSTAPSVSAAPSGSSGPSAPASSASSSPSASAAPSASSSASADAAFFVGKPAPPLSLKALDGTTLDLASLRGKPVWVNFMATWCPSSVDELPLMQGFAARYADTGLRIVLVDVREEAPAVKAFLASLKVTLPAGLDATGAAATAWRATALPIHFWIDKGGIVRDGAVGSIGPDVMAKRMASILPGVTVTP